jgi:hypothetical protein
MYNHQREGLGFDKNTFVSAFCATVPESIESSSVHAAKEEEEGVRPGESVCATRPFAGHRGE